MPSQESLILGRALERLGWNGDSFSGACAPENAVRISDPEKLTNLHVLEILDACGPMLAARVLLALNPCLEPLSEQQIINKALTHKAGTLEKEKAFVRGTLKAKISDAVFVAFYAEPFFPHYFPDSLPAATMSRIRCA